MLMGKKGRNFDKSTTRSRLLLWKSFQCTNKIRLDEIRLKVVVSHNWQPNSSFLINIFLIKVIFWPEQNINTSVHQLAVKIKVHHLGLVEILHIKLVLHSCVNDQRAACVIVALYWQRNADVCVCVVSCTSHHSFRTLLLLCRTAVVWARGGSVGWRRSPLVFQLPMQ